MNFSFSNLLQIVEYTAGKYPDRISHKFRINGNFATKTYSQFHRDIKILSHGFSHYGVGADSHVGFFVNNRYEWVLTDFALQALKAVSVPRGSDTPPAELQFILNHSDSTFLIVENKYYYTFTQSISVRFLPGGQ